MFRYLIKKFVILAFSFWCIISATFFLMHQIPGDPFVSDRVIPQEVLDSLYAHFGLDKPLFTQYIDYLKGLFQGDLGPSIVYQGRKVSLFIKEGLPVSFTLGVSALVISIFSGVFLGVLSALNKGKWQDNLSTLFITLGVSVPNFVLACLLQYFFAILFPVFPIAKWGSFPHAVLPILSLSLLPTAYIAKLVRENMIGILQKDYMFVALCKGLTPLQAAFRHGLKNALLPVIAYLGPLSSHLIIGSFVVEKIFAIPGLGQWMILSISARDYPMIMGLSVLFSASLLFFTFLSDLLTAFLDPRIRIIERPYE